MTGHHLKLKNQNTEHGSGTHVVASQERGKKPTQKLHTERKICALHLFLGAVLLQLPKRSTTTYMHAFCLKKGPMEK